GGGEIDGLGAAENSQGEVPRIAAAGPRAEIDHQPCPLPRPVGPPDLAAVDAVVGDEVPDAVFPEGGDVDLPQRIGREAGDREGAGMRSVARPELPARPAVIWIVDHEERPAVYHARRGDRRPFRAVAERQERTEPAGRAVAPPQLGLG